MLSQLSVYSLEKLAILFFLLSRSLTITFIYLFLFFFVFIFTFIESLLLGRKNRLLCVSLFCSTFLYILFFIQLFSFYPSSLIHFSTCMYTSFILHVRVFCVLCTCIIFSADIFSVNHVCMCVCMCKYIDICSRARMPTVYTDFKQLVFTRFFNQHFYNFLYFCSLIIVSHSVRRSVQLLLMLINVIFFFFFFNAGQVALSVTRGNSAGCLSELVPLRVQYFVIYTSLFFFFFLFKYILQ